ncbi:MAG: CoA transferase [Clostridiales bacterium]|nr:CoA transferase [Clostridiales bacterium]
MGIGPLTGIKVLDLTQFEAGTVCTETLAWMGAEVWKVERPGTGELGRHSVACPDVDTVGFVIMNMNKKSITCNLKTPQGIDLMKRLLKKADVIVENMGPGSIERLGLGYDDCKKVNEKIIFASIKGFAAGGPYADYPAFDPIATHTGGLVASTGLPEQPMKAGVSVADSGSGIACAMSIIAALFQRERQGIGQRVDIAMQDYIIGLSRSGWEPYYDTGSPPRRVGNGMLLEDVAPSNTYPCKPFGLNDYVHIYCSRAPGSKHFENLCRVIGREDLLQDERFATPRSRFKYRDILDPIIAEWTGRHTKQEAMDILARNDVPAGALLDVGDITNDPQYLESGMIIEIEHKDHGKLKLPGFAPRLSENHIEYKVSPALGENNREVYGGVLGLTDEEMEELVKAKVI